MVDRRYFDWKYFANGVPQESVGSDEKAGSLISMFAAKQKLWVSKILKNVV